MIGRGLRRNTRHGKRGRGHGPLALIPMIDMLTILVVYLLVHTADLEILPNSKNIAIPLSSSEQKPRETTVVMVTRDMLYVNGEPVLSVAELGAAPDPVVEALQAWRGVPCTVAVTLISEIGDLTRVDHPRALMTCLGRIPSD